MTRDLSTLNLAETQGQTAAPVFFVKLHFDEGPVCFHTDVGEIAWGGDTYTGAGSLGGIGSIDEDSELSRGPIQLTLSGIPASLVSLSLNTHYQGRPAELFAGFLDASGRLVDTPSLLRSGLMDTMVGTKDGQTAQLTLQVENEMARWDTPKVRRYNNADQQTRYPGDRGLEFVEQMVEKVITWGTPF